MFYSNSSTFKKSITGVGTIALLNSGYSYPLPVAAQLPEKNVVAVNKVINSKTQLSQNSKFLIAQTLPANSIYIGQVGVYDAYRTPSGLIILIFQGLFLVFDSIAQAVNYVGQAFFAATSNPSKEECSRAVKILTQYERLAQKLGSKIPARRLQELNRKRDAGTITSGDLPGTLLREFPGRFRGKTLIEIKRECGIS